MPRIRRPMFIWVPRKETINYKIEIDGTDETSNIVEAGFTNAIIGEESNFKIRLDNNNDRFTSLYSGHETVDFYLDFTDGTSKRFRGRIENIKKGFGTRGSIILLEGTNRYHSELLDITVTEEYSGTSGDNILKSLIDKYLTGFTSSNVTTTTFTPNFKWENVPFYDAVVAICNACSFDCYVDTDGDFHFFKRESIENTEEAIVQGDNLITTDGLLDDLVSIKNEVLVTSEDSEGNPILWTAFDSASQSLYGLKELIIKDTNISNEDQAKELADFNLKDAPETRGKATSFFLPSLMPGDFVWIVNPANGIHSQYRIVKFTHKLFNMTTSSVIAKSKDLPTFLKERKQAEAGLENLKNPFKMKYSYNFGFDNLNNIDTDASSNIEVLDSNLKIISGTSGVMISDIKLIPSTVTEAHLLVKGETLDGTIYEVNADGGDIYETISKDGRIDLSSKRQGTKLKIKVTINSASTRIASLALLVK